MANISVKNVLVATVIRLKSSLEPLSIHRFFIHVFCSNRYRYVGLSGEFDVIVVGAGQRPGCELRMLLRAWAQKLFC